MLKLQSKRTIGMAVLLGVMIIGCKSRSKEKPLPATYYSEVASRGEVLPKMAIHRLGTLDFVPTSSQTNRMDYSPDGRYLATAGFAEWGASPSRVEIWERETGKIVTPARLRGIDVTGVSWAPTNNRFVTSHQVTPELSSLNLWTVGDHHPITLGNSETSYHSVVWSPDGDRIAAWKRESNEIVVLNLDGNLQRTIGVSQVTKLIPSARVFDFTRGGDELAVISNHRVCFYDVNSGEISRELSVEQDQVINAIRILPTLGLVAIATDRGVLLRELTSQKTKINTLGVGTVIDVALSHDGQLLACSGVNMLDVWDVKTGRLSLSLPHDAELQGVAFSPNQSEMAIGTHRISFLRSGTWDWVQGPDQSFQHHHQLVTGQVFGIHFWTGEVGPIIREWNYENGNPLRSHRRDRGTTIAFARINEERFAVAGGVPEIEVKDSITGLTLFQLPGHHPATSGLAYEPKSRRLLSFGMDGKLRAWDLQAMKMTYEIPITDHHEDLPMQFVIAPDGESFVCCNRRNSELRAFSVANGSPLWTSSTIDQPSIVSPVTFTPDSTQIASIVPDSDGKSEESTCCVRITNAKTGEEVSRLAVQVPTIWAIAISPDGRYVVFCTRDRYSEVQIQAWSIATGKRAAIFPGLNRSFRAIYFSPDGDKLITLSTDTTAIVWNFKAAIEQGIGVRN